MTASFFKIEGSELHARSTEDEDWNALTEDSAGPFVGKAVTVRTRNALGVDAEAALLIEKNPEHPQFTDYWDSVNTLTVEAITELDNCLRVLNGA